MKEIKTEPLFPGTHIFGAFIALSDLSERLVGGDVYVKRAVAATLLHANGDPESNSAYSAGAFETQTLLGNIATAQDYASYRQNAVRGAQGGTRWAVA